MTIDFLYDIFSHVRISHFIIKWEFGVRRKRRETVFYLQAIRSVVDCERFMHV